MILRVSGFVFNMVCKRLIERAAYLWKALQIHTMAHKFYAFAPFVSQVHSCRKPVAKKKSFSGATSSSSRQIQEEHRQLSASMASLDVKQGHRPRKSKEAPKPPSVPSTSTSHASTPNFNGSRNGVEVQADSPASNRADGVAEDRGDRGSKSRSEVKRSASNHGNRPQGSSKSEHKHFLKLSFIILLVSQIDFLVFNVHGCFVWF